MTKQQLALVLAVSTMALTGCRTRAPEELPPNPTPVETAPATPTDTGSGSGFGTAQPGSQAHFEQTVGGGTTIFFDTDKFDIDSADQAALRTQAQYLQQFPAVSVTVEGHADERGTREYNLALGEQRANAARNFLVSLGIPEGRIRTVSFGKERPVALGSDESAWAQNRRAVTVVVN